MKSYFGKASHMRRDEWDAVEYVETAVLGLELLEEWEERLEFQDRRDDEVCGEGWVGADLEVGDLRRLLFPLSAWLF